MTDRAKFEPWQEGMPCRFRSDGVCIANVGAACKCLSAAYLRAGEEHIAEIGYINDDLEHALVSIYNPALLNPGAGSVQVALSIKGAVRLRDELDKFLMTHYGGMQ